MEVKQSRFHYAWVVAAVTFCVLVAAAGVRSAPSVMIVPLEKEFHWDRATISFAISVNLLLYGLIGPFAAALMDRLGIRRTVLLSMVSVSAAVALATLIRASWQLVALWGVIVGAGTGMVAIVLAATVANRWFTEKRGMVVGILAASSAAGQLVFLPLMASVVAKHGWRATVLGIAAVAALIVPLSLLLRDSPAHMGLRPYGETGPPLEPAPRPTGDPFLGALHTLRDGVRSRDFWLLAGSFFVCGASTNGLIGTHLIPACLDQGMPEVKAAGLLAMMGLFDIAGTTASGWLSDRLDNRVLLSWYYGLRGLSLVFLPVALREASWTLTLFVVFYGLDWIATVPPTVRLTGDRFGRAKAGMMFGWIMAAHQMGAASAAYGAGWISSWSGSYERAFMISGALCLLTAAMVLRISGPRREPRREEEPSLAPPDAVLEPAH